VHGTGRGGVARTGKQSAYQWWAFHAGLKGWRIGVIFLERAVLKLVVVFAAAAILAVPGAKAACESGSQTVFSCLTAKGKVIQVCDTGKTIDYSFGKPGQPEIVVRAARAQASTFQWQGVGRNISYTVNVPNGNTTYNVYWAADRLSEAHPVEAGVNVEKDRKRIATVRCVGEKHIIQAIEGIDLKPDE